MNPSSFPTSLPQCRSVRSCKKLLQGKYPEPSLYCMNDTHVGAYYDKVKACFSLKKGIAFVIVFIHETSRKVFLSQMPVPMIACFIAGKLNFGYS